MTEQERYASAAAVESAIRDAARNAAASDPSLSVSERIRQEYFRRFLSRVFSEREGSNWLLKGGTGLLARVPSARATRDVDLFRAQAGLDAALDELRRLASIDLGDFFRFEYLRHAPTIGGGQQTYTDGYDVEFDVYIGASRKEALRVDLVVGAVVTGEVTVQAPANGLALPRLPSHAYRLYPVVDQIADKVCATLAEYRGTPSTREKDLVDLVVIAMTEDVSAEALRTAILTEAAMRSLGSIAEFTVPNAWGAVYTTLARSVPHCADFRTVELAAELMRDFVDPVLRNEVAGTTWRHTERAWRN